MTFIRNFFFFFPGKVRDRKRMGGEELELVCVDNFSFLEKVGFVGERSGVVTQRKHKIKGLFPTKETRKYMLRRVVH